MRILIVEDEYSLADVIASKLKKENYMGDISLDGEEGLYNALSNSYDLIILDVMLPKLDGFEVLKKIREHEIESKVIMLTAKSTLDDKLTGFVTGANDYLTKPFHMDELLARINVQLKGPVSKKNNILKFNDISLNLDSLTLICNDNSIELVCKEFQLLEYLMRNENQVLSKEQIYDKVWGIDNEIESNNLEAYLSFLRKKLKAINSKTTIKSVRGLGYKLECVE